MHQLRAMLKSWCLLTYVPSQRRQEAEEVCVPLQFFLVSILVGEATHEVGVSESEPRHF